MHSDEQEENAKQPGTDFRAGYVALVGEPNVGKSTLLNSILQQKIAIVTPKAQTTRHKILGIHSTEQYQIIFLDTPGIISPHYALHEAMMRFTASAIEDADLLLFMADAARLRRGHPAAEEAFQRLAGIHKPVFLILNKIDLVKKGEVPALVTSLQARYPFKAVFPLSALRGEGIDALLDAIVQALPRHPPFYPLDIVSEQQQRFFVAEMIREKIFMQLHEEVPYSTTVDIVEFAEREEGKWFISADVYVERDSQKGIVIGKGGTKLKEIGRLARQEIEKFLEHPVYLDLHVKVREGWRNDEAWLRRLGYRAE